MAVLDVFSRAWRLVSSLLGRSFRDWSEWAVRDPIAAAHELDLISALLEGRARAYRKQDGWRARRDREVAGSIRAHARRLRASATPEELAAACAVVPGTMPGVKPRGEVRSLP